MPSVMHKIKQLRSLGTKPRGFAVGHEWRAKWGRTGGCCVGSALGAAALPLPAPSLPPLPGMGVPAAAAGAFFPSAACGAGCGAAAPVDAAAIAGVGGAAEALGLTAGGSAAVVLAARALPGRSVAVAEAAAAGPTAAPALASLWAGTVGAAPVAGFARSALVCLFSLKAGVVDALASADPPDPAWLNTSRLSFYQDEEYAEAPGSAKSLTCHSSILSEDMQLHQWQRSSARQCNLQIFRVASHLAHQSCHGRAKGSRRCTYNEIFCLTNIKTQLLHVTTIHASKPFLVNPGHKHIHAYKASVQRVKLIGDAGLPYIMHTLPQVLYRAAP